MKSGNFEYIPAVDQIRGLAALWIAIYHYYLLGIHHLKVGSLFSASTPFSEYLSYSFNPLYSLIVYGHTAVSLFMVLSGFIFTYGAADRDLSYVGFLRNRILRVYPLWVVLVLFGLFTTRTPVSLVTLVEAILPIGLHSAVAPWTPFTAMHWSLVIELQFYLIFPILIAASRKIGMQRLALSVLGALIFLRLLASAFGADNLYLAYYTILGRADQFILGMLLAEVYSRGWPSKKNGFLHVADCTFSSIHHINDCSKERIGYQQKLDSLVSHDHRRADLGSYYWYVSKTIRSYAQINFKCIGKIG